MDAKKRYRTKGNRLSGRLLILFKEEKTKQLWKVPLYESDILEAWKWYIQIGLSISSSEKDRLIGKIGKFKELLRIRHWVAHGRYWPLQLNIKKYPPELVCEAIEDLHGVSSRKHDFQFQLSARNGAAAYDNRFDVAASQCPREGEYCKRVR
jgi:hypothetical protein